MLSLPEHGEAGLCAAKLLGRMIMQGTDNVEAGDAALPQPIENAPPAEKTHEADLSPAPEAPAAEPSRQRSGVSRRDAMRASQ